MRSLKRANSGSCVTITIVCPARFKHEKISMISLERSESRLAVGSPRAFLAGSDAARETTPR